MFTNNIALALIIDRYRWNSVKRVLFFRVIDSDKRLLDTSEKDYWI